MGCGLLSRGQAGAGFGLVPLPCDSVPVTLNKMTSLVFPVAVRGGIRVSREIAVQKVAGVDNVIELKAMRKDFLPTNLDVFGVDGKLYSFELYYKENPQVLSYAVVDQGREIVDTRTREVGEALGIGAVKLSGLPVDEVRLQRDADSLAGLRGHLHKTARKGGVTMRLKGMYYIDGLLWLTLYFQNRSAMPYRPGYFRVYIADRRRGKRATIQEVSLNPVYGRLPEVILGEAKVVMGFRPFTAGKRKKLAVEVGEENGGRVMRVEVESWKVTKGDLQSSSAYIF
jgi:hypothetical protein